MKKYSEACEQNKLPILKILQDVFKDSQNILEIGSGSGQHAAYFAQHLNYLSWQPSDLLENLSSIQAWREEALLDNLKPPIELDVLDSPANLENFDGVFTANSLHIMSWPMVEAFFKLVAKLLLPHGKLLVYGPFAYLGEHTSPSNERFDQYLRQQNPNSGVRDVEDLKQLVKGLELMQDYAMPANNRCLLWQANS